MPTNKTNSDRCEACGADSEELTQAPTLPAISVAKDRERCRFVCDACLPKPLHPFVNGQRVRLRREVDRYPHFLAPVGAVGEVVNSDETAVWVRLDDPLEGAEPWGNEINWAEHDLERLVDDLEVLSMKKEDKHGR